MEPEWGTSVHVSAAGTKEVRTGLEIYCGQDDNVGEPRRFLKSMKGSRHIPSATNLRAVVVDWMYGSHAKCSWKLAVLVATLARAQPFQNRHSSPMHSCTCALLASDLCRIHVSSKGWRRFPPRYHSYCLGCLMFCPCWARAAGLHHTASFIKAREVDECPEVAMRSSGQCQHGRGWLGY